MNDTDSGFVPFIESWLTNRPPLIPEATAVSPRIEPLAGVRAVLFDVYGTLLVSASGDLDIATFSTQGLFQALEGLCPLAEDAAHRLIKVYGETIRADHARSPYPHPEVDIVSVWQEALRRLAAMICVRRISDRLPHLPGGASLPGAARSVGSPVAAPAEDFRSGRLPSQ